MAYLTIALCFFLCPVWIWVSDRLWRIHKMGTELYYNFVFKPTRIRSGTDDLRGRYKRYLTLLWAAEVACGIGTIVSASVMIKA
jgi:hypothetical protein